MKVSKKYIISIRQFLEDYYMLNYNWKAKLTHETMSEYLNLKSRYATKISFKQATTERILRGSCILVRDDVGKIIPYKNPRRYMDMESFEDESYKILRRIK